MVAKRLATSAKHSAMHATTTAQARNAHRPFTPASAWTFEGRPKIPAPMTPLIVSATTAQRPTARNSRDSAGG